MSDHTPAYPYSEALSPESAPQPHEQLAPALWLLGTWRGRGRGTYPTLDADFTYAQEVTFAHDGRPFLRYEARAWLIDGEDGPLRPAARESGWWRIQPEGRVEALITQPTGIAEIMVGTVTEGLAELASHSVALTPTAKEVTATRRRYTRTEGGGTLDFVHDLAAVGQRLQHHLGAKLHHAV
ncbi:FABP family protein [Streptomyces sp. NPDC050418]|uniref:FABP family protein n=1 Tax=Streptomyces sp. NPDC050418 TaxID=3365612 RepID=UPI0037BD677F